MNHFYSQSTSLPSHQKLALTPGLFRLLLVAALASSAVASPAFADVSINRSKGVVLSPANLEASQLSTLRAQVAAARKLGATRFNELTILRDMLPELDAAKRGPRPSIEPQLAAYFRQAGAQDNSVVWAVLEELSLHGARKEDLSEGANEAWISGMLETLGDHLAAQIRQAPTQVTNPTIASTRAVLAAILKHPGASAAAVRGAAYALGQLGDSASHALLTERLRGIGPHRASFIEGMGSARALVPARALAGILKSAIDPQELRATTKALGMLASSVAWRTPGLVNHPERTPVAKLAAKSLVSLYLRTPVLLDSAALSQELMRSLRMIDRSEVDAALQAEERNAIGTAATSLQELRKRIL